MIMDRWTADGMGKRLGMITDPQLMRLLSATPVPHDLLGYAVAVAVLAGRMEPDVQMLIQDTERTIAKRTGEVYAAFGVDPTKLHALQASERATCGILACLISDRIASDTYRQLISPVAYAFSDEWAHLEQEQTA
jgi:hypothetical protein